MHKKETHFPENGCVRLIGISYLRYRLLRASRISYNDKNYRSAARTSRLTFMFFRDRESLDILARSYLRLKKFEKATKCYQRAEKKGLSLLDHEINHFNSELGAGNYEAAFFLCQKIKESPNKRTHFFKNIGRFCE